MARKPRKQPSPEYVKELSEWLGRTMIAASKLEHTLAMLIGDLLKLNKLRYGALVVPMSTNSKTTLLRQLGSAHLSPADRKILRSVLEQVKDCAELRNTLVHGFYGAKRGKAHIVTHSGEGRFSGQPVEWTPNHLRAFVKNLSLLTVSVSELRPLFPKRLPRPRNLKAISPSV